MTATALENDVWAIYPVNSGGTTRSARNNLREKCKTFGWNFQEKASSIIKVNPFGRTRQILPGTEVTAIYRRAHRARVAIIVFAQTYVCLHPHQHEAVRRNLLVRLPGFFEYKCFIELLDDEMGCTPEWIDGFADRFGSVPLSPACEGARDPRCLPLHVFSNKGAHDLSQTAGRIAFDNVHGLGGHRTDQDGRKWRLNPHAYHGQDQLHICGTPLPQGCHWDVEPGGKSTLVVTTSDVWIVYRYVNIYPDSHVRGNKHYSKQLV